MIGSPAYELEKDWVVLFLQALCSGVTKVRVACELHADMDIACSFEGVCQIWCPRRSKAMYESQCQYAQPVGAEQKIAREKVKRWKPELTKYGRYILYTATMKSTCSSPVRETASR